MRNNRFRNLLKLLSFHAVRKVVVFKQTIDVEVILMISWQNFSLLFNSLIKFQHCFLALSYSNIHVGICFLELFSIELEHELIDIFATKLSEMLLIDHFLIVFGEFHGVKWKFWVTKVNKENNFSIFLFLRKLIHFIESIVESNSSWFADKLITITFSKTISGNLDWVKECLPLWLRQIVGNRNNLEFVVKVVQFSNCINFIEKSCSCLFRNKLFLLSLAFYLENKFILFNFRVAWGIFWLLFYIVWFLKSKVSVRCHNSVSQVRFHLTISCLANKSFIMSITDNRGSLSEVSFVGDDVYNSFLDSGYLSVEWTKVYSNNRGLEISLFCVVVIHCFNYRKYFGSKLFELYGVF